jgi:hypothetical protein
MTMNKHLEKGKSNKRYIFGPVALLAELFPGYLEGDKRHSLDKSEVIYEVNLTPEELAKVEQEAELLVLTHAEAIEKLSAPEAEEIWRPKKTLPAPPPLSQRGVRGDSE